MFTATLELFTVCYEGKSLSAAILIFIRSFSIIVQTKMKSFKPEAYCQHGGLNFLQLFVFMVFKCLIHEVEVSFRRHWYCHLFLNIVLLKERLRYIAKDEIKSDFFLSLNCGLYEVKISCLYCGVNLICLLLLHHLTQYDNHLPFCLHLSSLNYAKILEFFIKADNSSIDLNLIRVTNLIF